MTARDDLRTAVAARAAGTPYVLVDTPEGFDLRIDLADAQWYGALGAAGRKKVVQHRVAVDESRCRYTLVDDLYDVRWSAGAGPTGASAPRLEASARASRFRGRVHEVSFEKTLGGSSPVAAVMRPTSVLDVVFSSAEGQRMVREPAKALGWKQRAGWEVRVATVAAVVGGTGAIATIAWALWAWSSGAIG